MSEIKYLPCDSCGHEFEVEFVKGVAVYADGYLPDSIEPLAGKSLFKITHNDSRGTECDSALVVDHE